ncbi:MAG: inorganic phosphate transporter [Prevotella sp.]|nr:inorganic phosphate transporter [Prevotella sp.]MDY5665683.1 inorganic phosphate transporter [Alloprevotella sp.]
MEWMYLGMVIFLFILAAFDLWVGVSNDAVNFLNSAIGSRAAKFRTLVLIAGIGVFCGCVLSNGMMDIARHGIFSPQYFSFQDVMYIYLAVMVTDIVLLDIFNSFGMPTSTTVSMVFELLGAAFAFTMLKIADGSTALSMADYLNTSKALEVIMGIFLSVPIAFVFGSLIQYITRIVFTFSIAKNIRYKIGIFGGIAITAILYFMLFKGLKDLSFMNADVKNYIHTHILIILGSIFVVATIVMQLLHAFKVNVFRIIVLIGTLALSTAFAGNDLVNFIGVPLAGFSSFCDFTTNGAGFTPSTFMMSSLTESAKTPIYFLAAAGAIMVFALATSKKARKVTETEVGLSRKNEGDEMFGSSKVARSLVRWGNSIGTALSNITPTPIARFIDSRFQVPEEAIDNQAAYDMCRASTNLVMSSLLIALGTSLKLPLSTTFVTFMVAMGSSLADRAWSRESAVFRITGVLTVIGGWFITAGVAFSACFFVAMAMNFGGVVAVFIIVAAGIYSIIHSQQRFTKKQKELQEGDILFQQMLAEKDREAIIPMLSRHMNMSIAETLDKYSHILAESTDGLFSESLRPMRHALRELTKEKRELKNLRRRETICLRRAQPPVAAIRLSTNFHLIHNSLRQMLYGIIRMAEPAREHVDNNFSPIEPEVSERFCRVRNEMIALMNNISENMRNQRATDNDALIEQSKQIELHIADFNQQMGIAIQGEDNNLNAYTLVLHMGQELQQLAFELSSLLTTDKNFRQQL